MWNLVLIVFLTVAGSRAAAYPRIEDMMMGRWNGNSGRSEQNYFNGCGERELEFGRDTWNFLHTLAANYPENPSPEQQAKMSEMMRIFTEFSPHPNQYYRTSVMQDSPDTTNRRSFSQWMCRVHNNVNQMTGKPMFDCNTVNAVWMNDCYENSGAECDPDRSQSGRATWNFMHTYAYTYRDSPSPEQQEDMRRLMYFIAEFYPSPNFYYIYFVLNEVPDTRDRDSFMNWMCRVHNYVNKRMGKPEFDCSRVWDRWQYGGCESY